MQQSNRDSSLLELLTIIVNNGVGTKILRAARKCGVCGGTVLLGRGTVENSFLKLIELYEEEKEIVLIVAGKSAAFNLLEYLDKEFNFSRPHHGIAFCTPVKTVVGSKGCKTDIHDESEGAKSIMYNAIYVIVEKGKAEAVIDAATAVGATGGTIMNARGSGIHETSKLFSMEIEPEKEVVLIISEVAKTEEITASINNTLNLDEPGNGIMFVQEVSKVLGLRSVLS